ncbi:hypothetical protein MMC30_008978 [Trapelia coarctata]|nr:hypothetical protein [Trapelia coarctata]
MADRHSKVIIVGGSLAGLMHGIVLRRLGLDVHILEHNPTSNLESQGAGIAVMEDVQRFLSQYDTSGEPYSVPSRNVQFLDHDVKITKTWDVTLQMTSWSVLYYRLRANFDGFASDFCPRLLEGADLGPGKAKYDNGKTVKNIECSDGLVTVEFDDARGGHGTLHANLVIAADGSTSKIRQMLQPDLQRKYTGYVVWRGTVAESDVSEQTNKIFGEKTTIHKMYRSYIALYTIPGDDGSLKPGERCLNYVWYCNYPEDSQEYADLMTDTNGHRHRNTLPMGKMREDIWAKQKAYAIKVLPAPFAELLVKTKHPFISAVGDIASRKAAFHDGKLLLVGDALLPFRTPCGVQHQSGSIERTALGSADEWRDNDPEMGEAGDAVCTYHRSPEQVMGSQLPIWPLDVCCYFSALRCSNIDTADFEALVWLS